MNKQEILNKIDELKQEVENLKDDPKIQYFSEASEQWKEETNTDVIRDIKNPKHFVEMKGNSIDPNKHYEYRYYAPVVTGMYDLIRKVKND